MPAPFVPVCPGTFVIALGVGAVLLAWISAEIIDRALDGLVALLKWSR